MGEKRIGYMGIEDWSRLSVNRADNGWVIEYCERPAVAY